MYTIMSVYGLWVIRTGVEKAKNACNTSMYRIYQNQFWEWVCGQRLNSEFSSGLFIYFFNCCRIWRFFPYYCLIPLQLLVSSWGDSSCLLLPLICLRGRGGNGYEPASPWLWERCFIPLLTSLTIALLCYTPQLRVEQSCWRLVLCEVLSFHFLSQSFMSWLFFWRKMTVGIIRKVSNLLCSWKKPA